MVSVSESAELKLNELIGADGGAVRVAVIRGPHGCVHGWQLAVEEQQSPDDIVVPAGEVRVLIEPELGDLLEGASIDYREDATGIGFTIDAPQAAHGHGHGQGHGGGGCHHG